MTNTDELTNIGLRKLLTKHQELGPLLFQLGIVSLKQIGNEYVYVDGRVDFGADDNETVQRLSDAYNRTELTPDSGEP